MLPYPAPDKRFRSHQRAARQAVVLFGAAVVTMGSAFVVGALALHRLDLHVDPRFEFPDLETLSPESLAPRWTHLRTIDITTGASQRTQPIPPEVALALTPVQENREIDPQTRVIRNGQVASAEDIATGAVRWSAGLHRSVLGFGPVTGTAVGVVVFGNSAGSLTETVFLDTATGRELWHTSSGLLSSFAYDSTTATLYEYGEDRALVARDPALGTIRWRVDRPYGRLFADQGTVWVSGGGRLDAYDGTTGALRSETVIPDLSETAALVAVSGATAVIAEP